jgi:hypothetical protein
MTSADLDGHSTGLLVFGAPMNMTTGERNNYTIYTSTDGGNSWAWGVGVDDHPNDQGYSGITVLGTQKLSSGSWRVDVGVSFQLGHGIHGVEGGGYDIAFARRSIVVGP